MLIHQGVSQEKFLRRSRRKECINKACSGYSLIKRLHRAQPSVLPLVIVCTDVMGDDSTYKNFGCNSEI